ncbi:60S ribosomal protein L20 [Cryomyces antarcticus]
MNCNSISRALPRAKLSSSQITPLQASTSGRRHESSYRRTQKRLRVKPDPSFTNTTTHQDHIIFNPPSSAPSVYHTPLKFLPKGDRRRDLYTSASSPSSSSHTTTQQQQQSTPTPSARLPPALKSPTEKKYHLTESDIASMRELRAADPRQWTRVRLAQRFECSEFFVSLCCHAPEIKKEREQQLEDIKRRWGRRKTEARQDRQRRKESWGRDE